MSVRINYKKAAPGAYQAMRGLENHLYDCGLEVSLLELVKMRISQISGCVYYLDMNPRGVRAASEMEQRLDLLNAWREAPFFCTARERVALVWTAALILVSESHVPNEVYNEARQHFSEQELVNLSLAIVIITGWNRLVIDFCPKLEHTNLHHQNNH